MGKDNCAQKTKCDVGFGKHGKGHLMDNWESLNLIGLNIISQKIRSILKCFLL